MLVAPLYGCADDELESEQEGQAEETAEADGADDSQSEDAKKEPDGPAITFSDVAVSVELHDSSVFSTSLLIEGNVTNNTAETMNVLALPKLLETYNDDTKDERPKLGVLDDGEDIYDIEPGESVPFYYLSFPDDNYSDWEFEQQENYDFQGLDGVADDIEYKLDAVWEEFLQITREKSEQRRAENQAKYNRCYVTPNGGSYHRTQGCKTLSRSSEIEETTVDKAEAQGYVACEACY